MLRGGIVQFLGDALAFLLLQVDKALGKLGEDSLRFGGQATSIATTCSSPMRESAVMSNV